MFNQLSVAFVCVLVFYLFILWLRIPLYDYIYMHSPLDGPASCFMYKLAANTLVHVFVEMYTHFSWVYTLEWDCWVMRQTCVTLPKWLVILLSHRLLRESLTCSVSSPALSIHGGMG